MMDLVQQKLDLDKQFLESQKTSLRLQGWVVALSAVQVLALGSAAIAFAQVKNDVQALQHDDAKTIKTTVEAPHRDLQKNATVPFTVKPH